MDSKTIFAQRFKSARLMRGFSLNDLAKATNNKMSRQALHRYEKGEVMPNMETIEIIRAALGVTSEYFFRPTSIELGPIEYRKKSKLSKKTITSIEEKTKEYLSNYLELEEILGISTKFENVLSDFPEITNFNDVEKAAVKLRDCWNLGQDAVYNVVELLEDNNIKVVRIEVDEEFDGLQTYVKYMNKEYIPVVAYNSKKENKADRIRLTLLHELAHLLLKFNNVTESQKEKLCFQFAGAVLLPKNTLISELGKKRTKLSINELGNVKKQYGISMQAIVMRAKDCEIISENYTKNFFFMIKQMNWRVNEPEEYKGLEESNRFEQLLYRALIEEHISWSKAASLKNQTLAEFKAENNSVF